MRRDAQVALIVDDAAAAVIVPARDAAATLPATLDALARQTVRPRVIVVDDGSRDATAALAQAHPAVSTVVRTGRSRGPGAARNAGVRVTTAGALAFTDADCVPAPDWLRAGLRGLENADLLQGRVEPDPEAPRHPLEHTIAVAGVSGMFETANLFVRREWFERVGGFGDGVGTADRPYGEDVLFGWAARHAGARVAFSADALVHHAVFPRGPRAYVRSHLRHGGFPKLVREVPELRDEFLWRRWFLSTRTAKFDAAIAGVVAAAVSRRLPPVALATPYALAVARRARHSHRHGHRAATVAAALVAGDAVSALSLLRGSLQARTPIL